MPRTERRSRALACSLALAAGVSSLSGLAAQTPPRDAGPVAELSNLGFHSDVWMNLHHTLYAAAWAGRPEAGTPRALAGRLPAPLDAPLTAEERRAWDAAVAYYDRELAARDLLFDRGMMSIKRALVARSRTRRWAPACARSWKRPRRSTGGTSGRRTIGRTARGSRRRWSASAP
jgi:hypothetical protein